MHTTNMSLLFSKRDFYGIGCYIKMSINPVKNGFLTLHDSLYAYICSKTSSDFKITTDDLPEETLSL